MLKSLRLALTLLLLTVFSASCGNKALSEASVLSMLDKVQTAAKQHDVDALIAHFAADATITMELPESAGGTLKLSLEQYKEMLAQGWNAQSGGMYEVSDIEVKVAADGKSAVASSTVRESAQIMGRTINSVSKERVQIGLRNGQPKMTSVSAVVRMF